MNLLLIGAGIICSMTTLGHFIVGSKLYLKPMLDASFDQVAKKVMHCVFHYVSVYLILSSIVLLLRGFNIQVFNISEMLVKFISLNFAAFAIWQIGLALTSEIPNSIFKLFQWIFFVTIALLAWFGA